MRRRAPVRGMDDEHLPALTPVNAGPADDLPAVGASDLAAAWLAGRRPTTLRAYRADLADFARFLGASSQGRALDRFFALEQGRAHSVALAYRASLVERGLAAATVARRLAALRSLAKLARQLGRCPWRLEIEGPRAEAFRDTEGPGRDGWRAMLDLAKLDAATKGPKAVRDLALIRCLHDLALRRSEAAGLDVEHCDRAGKGPVAAVWILGKGRSTRERLTVPRPTGEALAAWLDVRGSAPGPLFVRLDRAGIPPGGSPGMAGRLSGESIRLVVAELGKRAGLSRVPRPHGLRHQGITRALDLTNGDVRAAQRFARHASPATTMRYDDNRKDLAGELARRVADDD